MNEMAASGERDSCVPTLAELFAAFLRIGVLSFGGPAAQIALMHRVLVDEKRWLTERQYLDALSFCMLLPGPEAMQLATYAGWRLHGLIGGLIGGLLFVLPGASVILVLAAIYAWAGDVPLVQAVFLGVKAAVLVIVIEALLKVARRALNGPEHWWIAGLAFVGIFFLGLPFPLIVLLAAAAGFWLGAHSPDGSNGKPAVTVPFMQTITTVVVWLAIWWLPVLALDQLFGVPVLADIGAFFSKLAVVTFGGAYAVLAYMAQEVVGSYGWLSAGEMMDGLGLAETTPGPLILVTEFVGFLAAYREGGWLLGLAGALLTLWVTFVPCFLWIFAGAPYLTWITGQPRLRGSLTAITAAVVGVILNLSIWFGLHVLFAEVRLVHLGVLQLWWPDFATLDWRVMLLSSLSAWLLLGRHWGIAPVLGIAALGGLATNFLA